MKNVVVWIWEWRFVCGRKKYYCDWMYQEVHSGLMFHRNQDCEGSLWWCLGCHKRGTLLGLSLSLSYIELFMFWQSAWYHKKQASHSTPLQDQVTCCSQLPHGKTVEFPSMYTCVWMGPGFDSMSSERASSRREIYRKIVCTAFPFFSLSWRPKFLYFEETQKARCSMWLS